MSITNFVNNCKQFLLKMSQVELWVTLLVAILIIEVFVSGLLLDQRFNSVNESIAFKQNQLTAVIDEISPESDQKIVASKNGKRYYFPHCSGVKRIKEANKIYFISENEAKDRGLTLASGCR